MSKRKRISQFGTLNETNEVSVTELTKNDIYDFDKRPKLAKMI